MTLNDWPILSQLCCTCLCNVYWWLTYHMFTQWAKCFPACRPSPAADNPGMWILPSTQPGRTIQGEAHTTHSYMPWETTQGEAHTTHRYMSWDHTGWGPHNTQVYVMGPYRVRPTQHTGICHGTTQGEAHTRFLCVNYIRYIHASVYFVLL